MTQDTRRSIDKTIFANCLLEFKADGNVYNFACKTNFNCWNELKTKARNKKNTHLTNLAVGGRGHIKPSLKVSHFWKQMFVGHLIVQKYVQI